MDTLYLRSNALEEPSGFCLGRLLWSCPKNHQHPSFVLSSVLRLVSSIFSAPDSMAQRSVNRTTHKTTDLSFDVILLNPNFPSHCPLRDFLRLVGKALMMSFQFGPAAFNSFKSCSPAGVHG